MNMKGKLKIDFLDWYMSNYSSVSQTWNNFNRAPIEMKFGVIQLFADSKGFDLVVTKLSDNDFESSIEKGDIYLVFVYLKTRPEAVQEAVKQFEKYYNERN